MKALVVPFGYNCYPADVLQKRIDDSKEHLSSLGVDYICTGSIIELTDLLPAREFMRTQDFDYIICIILSWIEATNVCELVDEYKHLPMLLWSHENLQTETELLSFGAIASAAVMRESFEELAYRFKFVVGNPFDKKIEADIQAFDAACNAIANMKTARLGYVGYTSMGMYTGLADHVKVKRTFGSELFHIDQYSLIKPSAFDSIPDSEIERVLRELKDEWDISEKASDENLLLTVKIYLRMKQLMQENLLCAITVKCQYEMSLEYGFSPCLALSLLGMEYPVCCEGDVNETLSQMILHGVSGGKPTTYGDTLHFFDDGIICAACGFAPRAFLKDSKPSVDCHTAIVTGLLITSSFKEQQITMIRLAPYKDSYKLHLIKGRIEELKDFHEIGCPQYSGSIIRFENKTVEEFKNEIMSQHYAIISGDYEREVRQWCELMGVKVI